MSARGIKPGAEYRYYLSETTKGAIMLDGFNDRKTDDSGDPDDPYGFEDPSVQLPRTNTDRWWFRMSHYQKVPWNFDGKLDLDVVSDQDYLREFENGYMGFKDKQKLVDDFTWSGNSLGIVLDAGYDIYKSKFFSIGLELNLFLIVSCIALVFIIQSIPLTILGFGTREAALIFYMSGFGIEIEKILTVDIIFILVPLVGLVISGCFWIAKYIIK